MTKRVDAKGEIMKRKMRLVLGNCVAAILAVGIFISIFCKFTPWVCSLVPENQWKRLIDVAIFITVGLCGGIGLPAVIGVVGVMVAIAWADGATKNVGD